MKKVPLNASRPSAAEPRANADHWVEDRETTPREAKKRFTIDVPVSLHKRVKSQCALQDLVMADVMRELLEQRFPPTRPTNREGES